MAQLTLEAVPGFSDLPDGVFTGGTDVAQGRHVAAILENTKAGVVRPEVFVGIFEHGEQVPLPVSPVDGYQYARDELIYAWEWARTTNKEGHNPLPGTMLWFNAFVKSTSAWPDAELGEIFIRQVYHVTGGATSETTEGQLQVFTIAIRRKGELSIGTAPTWANQADTNYDQDSAATQARMEALNRNAKFGVVSAEILYMGTFTDGQTVPTSTSPVDSYAYSRGEVFLLPLIVHSLNTSGRRSGPGTISRLQKTVNNTNGLVDITTTYREGSRITTSSDGEIAVLAFCQRSKTITGTVAFSDLDDANFFAGELAEDADFVQVNQNAKFAALRPEFFTTTITDGSTVPLQTSAVDSYSYLRAEQAYIYVTEDTGPISASGGDPRLLRFKTDIGQATGIATLDVTYHDPGGRTTLTNDGTLRVFVFGTRTHDQPASEDPADDFEGGGHPGDIRQSLLNPGFELWTQQAGQTIADDWREEGVNGDASFARGVGLMGGSAQNLIVGTAGVGNSCLIRSSGVLAHPGEMVFASWYKKATVATTGAFFFRIFLFDSNYNGTAYFHLETDGAVSTSWVRTAATFIMPANGATTVKTSLGVESITNTLNYDPAIIEIEVMNFQPNVASTFSIDAIVYFRRDVLRDIFDDSEANGDRMKFNYDGAGIFGMYDDVAGQRRRYFDISNVRQGMFGTPSVGIHNFAGTVAQEFDNFLFRMNDTQASGTYFDFTPPAAGGIALARTGSNRYFLNSIGHGYDVTPATGFHYDGVGFRHSASAPQTILRDTQGSGVDLKLLAGGGGAGIPMIQRASGIFWRMNTTGHGFDGSATDPGLHLFGTNLKAEVAGNPTLKLDSLTGGTGREYSFRSDGASSESIWRNITAAADRVRLAGAAAALGIGGAPESARILQAYGTTGLETEGSQPRNHWVNTQATGRTYAWGSNINSGVITNFELNDVTAGARRTDMNLSGEYGFQGAPVAGGVLSISGVKFATNQSRLDDPRRNLAAHTTYRPLTNPLVATDAGSNVSVNVASFTMRVGGVDISITGASPAITALSFSTLYFIYYDDAGFAGGSVTFQATTTKETAINAVGRFFVGSIFTPVDGDPDTIGNNDGGVGAQAGRRDQFVPTAWKLNSGTQAFTDPQLAADGRDDTNSFAIRDSTGTTTDQVYEWYIPLPAFNKGGTVWVRSRVDIITGTPTVRLRYDGWPIGSPVDFYAVTVDRAIQYDTQAIAAGEKHVEIRATYQSSNSGWRAAHYIYGIFALVEL